LHAFQESRSDMAISIANGGSIWQSRWRRVATAPI
jgi:hypothetical protein